MKKEGGSTMPRISTIHDLIKGGEPRTTLIGKVAGDSSGPDPQVVAGLLELKNTSPDVNWHAGSPAKADPYGSRPRGNQQWWGIRVNTADCGNNQKTAEVLAVHG